MIGGLLFTRQKFSRWAEAGRQSCFEFSVSCFFCSQRTEGEVGFRPPRWRCSSPFGLIKLRTGEAHKHKKEAPIKNCGKSTLGYDSGITTRNKSRNAVQRCIISSKTCFQINGCPSQYHSVRLTSECAHEPHTPKRHATRDTP